MQYKKVMYLLEDRPEHRRLVHRYLEVAEYPDGRIELWADGGSLPYTTYDRLSEIDQGAVVEHKRLGHMLAIAAQVQALRDSRQTIGPSRALVGEPPRPHRPAPNTKRQRLINRLDLERALAAASLHPGGALLETFERPRSGAAPEYGLQRETGRWSNGTYPAVCGRSL